MRRLALRFYLPIVQIVFLLGFLAADQIERYEATHRLPGVIGWDLRSINRPNIYGEAFAILNAPAICLVSPFLLIFREPNEWLLGLLFGFAILLFWYGLGRFFDRRRGLLPPLPSQQRGRGWWVLRWLGLIVAATAIGLGVYLLAAIQDFDALALSLIGWPGFFGWLLISEMRRFCTSGAAIRQMPKT